MIPKNNMTFQSKSQARRLFALNPKLAKEFSEKTGNMKALPEKKKKPIVPKV